MSKRYQSIQEFLSVEVPREIQAVIDRGGVNCIDWVWLTQEINDEPNDLRPLNVLARADEYLLYPSNLEKHVDGLLVFRKAISLLAFVPGGIRIYGLHFSVEIDGFVEQVEWHYSPAEWAVMEHG